MRNLIPTCALIALLLPVAPASMTAQDENLVPNGSFENGDSKKLKAYGQLEDFTTDEFDRHLQMYKPAKAALQRAGLLIHVVAVKVHGRL